MSDIHLHPPIIELSYKEEIENLINTKNLENLINTKNSKIYVPIWWLESICLLGLENNIDNEDIVPFQ